jgi:hypothetical protein
LSLAAEVDGGEISVPELRYPLKGHVGTMLPSNVMSALSRTASLNAAEPLDIANANALNPDDSFQSDLTASNHLSILRSRY